MKKINLFILCLLAVFLPLSATQAFTVKNGDNINIALDETISDNVYTAGQNLSVNGKIDGDLVFGTANLTINGEVNGDLIGFSNNITINGKVNGNIRVVGENIVINGVVAKNANVAGTNIILNETAEIGKDLLLATEKATLKGKINNDLHGLSREIVISGAIGRNVFLRFFNETPAMSGKQLTIGESAIINGSLNYTSASSATLAQNATIKDGVHHSPISGEMKSKWNRANSMGNLFSLFAALVMGLVLVSLWGKKVKEFISTLSHKPAISIGIGAAIMFLTPFVALFLIVTLIGIPLALTLIALWLIAIYISKILVAIMIGEKIFKKFAAKKTISLIWVMILGIIVSWTVFSIPIIGWLLSLVASWWGLGAMFFRLKDEK